MSESSPQARAEHDRNTKHGITFVWTLSLTAMIVIVAVIAGSEVAGNVVSSQVEALAAGSVNAIGLVAIGGINAIGVVSLGMVNSIGVVAIGGVNSVGVIAIGGYNATGLITIGGVNSYQFPFQVWSATLFMWNPRISDGSGDAG